MGRDRRRIRKAGAWSRRFLRLALLILVLYIGAVAYFSQLLVSPHRLVISDTVRPVVGIIMETGENEEGPEKDRSPGVRLSRVVSPAREAGLKAGDRIVRVNGQEVEDASAVAVLVRSAPEGTPVRIEAKRNGPDPPVTTVLVSVLPERRPLSPGDEGLSYQEVSFQDRSGATLRGWYIPPPEPQVPRGAPAVVYGHGNGTDRRHWLPVAWEVHQAGFGQLLFDFAGRGESDGDTITLGPRESEGLIAALDYLESREEIDPTRLALAGRSMGASAACLAAGRDPRVRALILDSPFTSLPRELDHVIRTLYRIPPLLVRPAILAVGSLRTGYELSRVRPLAALEGYSGPILLFHGKDDTLVPPRNALEFKRRFGERLRLVLMDDTGHNFGRPGEYAKTIADFLAARDP